MLYTNIQDPYSCHRQSSRRFPWTMGMNIPLTGGQLRLAFVTAVICVAVYLILYISAAFETTATTEQRHPRDGIDDDAGHVFLRARWKHDRILDKDNFQRGRKESEVRHHTEKSSDYKATDSGDRLISVGKRTGRRSGKGQNHPTKLNNNSGKSSASGMASAHRHPSKAKVCLCLYAIKW